MQTALNKEWLPPVARPSTLAYFSVAFVVLIVFIIILLLSIVLIPVGVLFAVGWLCYLIVGLLMKFILVPAFNAVMFVMPSVEIIGLRLAHWGFMTRLGQWKVFQSQLDSKRAKPHFRPFACQLGNLEVLCVPIAWDFNVAYFIRNAQSKDVIVVDPADSKVISGIIRAKGWNLTHILTTHMHWDHSGGNKELKKLFPSVQVIGWPTVFSSEAGSDALKMSATINGIAVHAFRCGLFHTKDHIAFLVGDDTQALFAGDALFMGANGGLFQGNIADLWRDITNLRRCISPETLIFSGHTYEAFQTPVFVAPEHERAIALRKLRIKERQRRFRGPLVPSQVIPSTMQDELLTNPLFWLVGQSSPPVFKLGPKGCTYSCCPCLDASLSQGAASFYRLRHIIKSFWDFHLQQIQADPSLSKELEAKESSSWMSRSYTPSLADLSCWTWIRSTAEIELKMNGNIQQLLVCYLIPTQEEAGIGSPEIVLFHENIIPMEKLSFGDESDEAAVVPSTGANQRQVDFIYKALESVSDGLQQTQELDICHFSLLFEQALLYFSYEPPIGRLLMYIKNERELRELNHRRRDIVRQIQELETKEQNSF